MEETISSGHSLRPDRLSAVILCCVLLPCAGAADTGSAPLSAQIATALAGEQPQQRLEKLVQLGKTLEAHELRDALRRAENFKELRERAVFRETVLTRWVQIAPGDAFEYIVGLPESRLKIDAARAAVPKFAALDVQKAAAAALRMPAGQSRNEAIALVAETWARTDVKAALFWTHSLPPGPAKAGALHNIRFIWVHSDPASASAHVQSLPTNEIKNALIANVAGEWAGRDPKAAIRWAEGLAEGEEKQVAYSNIAESWADREPQAAAAFAMGLSASYQSAAVLAVVSRWATQDPLQALTWVLNSAEPTLREPGTLAVFQVWVPVEPERAERSIQSLAAGPGRATAIRAFVATSYEIAPDACRSVAAREADTDSREQLSKQCTNP